MLVDVSINNFILIIDGDFFVMCFRYVEVFGFYVFVVFLIYCIFVFWVIFCSDLING